MKKFLVLLLISISYLSNAQQERKELFKVNDYIYGNQFEAPDTVAAIGFSGDSFIIGTEKTTMNYSMSFYNKTGNLVYVKSITYKDLENAAKKAGMPTNNIPAFLATIQQTMVVGTLSAKITMLNQILNSYGLVIKAESLQNGLFDW